MLTLAPAALGQTPPVVTPPAAGPPASSVVSTPSSRTLYRDGPSGRFLVDGPWLYRADPSINGDGQGWQRDPSTNGWMLTTVPNAWNATDESPASFAGAVGWYRKDFRLPSTAKRLMWTARFESINYKVTIWLNGRFARHAQGRLPAVRAAPAARLPQADRRQPPRAARRQPPHRERLPAGEVRRARAPARRLVELRRHPARGLPARDRRHRLRRGRRAARPAVRHAARRRSTGPCACATPARRAAESPSPGTSAPGA